MKILSKCAVVVFVVLVYLVMETAMHSTQVGGNSFFDVMIKSYGVPIALMFVVCGLVLINIMFAALGKNTMTFRKVLFVKLLLVPFFVINFRSWLFGATFMFTFFMVIPMLPVIILYTYIVMLGMSAYNIGILVRLLLKKRMRVVQCVIHIILQLTFGLDVIDSVVLAIRQKRWCS